MLGAKEIGMSRTDITDLTDLLFSFVLDSMESRYLK